MQEEEYSGVVRKEVINKGSKSERDAVLLGQSDDEFLILRRKNTNPYEEDSVLESLVGQHITCKGLKAAGKVLVISSHQIQPPSSSS